MASSERIRLGLFMYASAIGGAEQYLRDLLWHLDRTCYSVTLFYEPWPAFERFLGLEDCPPLRRWPIPVYESHAAVRERVLAPAQGLEHARQVAGRAVGFGLRTVNRYLLLRDTYERLRRSFVAAPVDLLHINNGGYPGAWSAQLAGIAARAAGVPVRVMTVNNTPTGPRFPQLIERRLDGPALGAIDHFVAVAEIVGRTLTRRYGVEPGRISRIYYGVGAPPPNLAEGDHAAIRRDHGLRPDDLVIGMPARFAPEKGHRYLLEALVAIRGALSGRASLLLMGSGPLLEQTRAAAREAGLDALIRFTGQLSHEETLRSIAACDFIVLPSEIEGLPYVISEAMSLGKPVIATAVGGVPEQIADGETGLVIEPRNPEQLARALLALADDPELRARMSAAAAERYARHFTLARMLADHDKLYQTLLQERHAPRFHRHPGL